MLALQAEVKKPKAEVLTMKQKPEIRALPKRVFLKDGLPPLKQACEFLLSMEEQAPPFLRFDCVNLDLSYVLIDPFVILPEYAPEFSDADCAEIDLKSSDKPIVLAIVNFSRGVEQASANLVGPLLIHPVSGKAKQTILMNSNLYSSRFDLIR